MQRRICPICDHPIKYGHYCSFCKQWIRNPNYVNATYYLNERHPASEEHCSFHDPWEEEKGQKPAKAAMPNVSANRQRSINPNVYGGAKDRSEQARQVAAMARGESRKTTNRTSMMSSERTQTVINGKVVNGNTTTKRTTTSNRQKNGGGIPLPVILFIVVILLNTCGRMF